MTNPKKWYEFKFNFEADSDEEADAMVDAMIEVYCSGKPLAVTHHEECVRGTWVGSGPVEIDLEQSH